MAELLDGVEGEAMDKYRRELSSYTFKPTIREAVSRIRDSDVSTATSTMLSGLSQAGSSYAAAGSDDFLYQCVGSVCIAVAMNDDVTAVGGQPPADRRADAAAATGDQGALHVCDSIARCLPASRTTAARPCASVRLPAATRKP